MLMETVVAGQAPLNLLRSVPHLVWLVWGSCYFMFSPPGHADPAHSLGNCETSTEPLSWDMS